MFVLADVNPYLEAPKWLNSGDTAWQLTAATFVGMQSIPGLAILYARARKEEMGAQLGGHGVLRLRRRALELVAARLQHELRQSGKARSGNSLGACRHSRSRALAVLRDRTIGRAARSERYARAPFPGLGDDLFPIRLRGDHADLDRGFGFRTHELQGVDDLRAGVEFDRVLDRRILAVGRRLARATRCRRLLRRLRDSSCGWCFGIRRGCGCRSAFARRSTRFRTEQPDHGFCRRGHSVARLERLQRRRPIFRQCRCRRGRAQHQHRDGNGAAGVARRGYVRNRQTQRGFDDQRHDRRPCRDHAVRRLRQRLWCNRRRRGDDHSVAYAELSRQAFVHEEGRRHVLGVAHARRCGLGRRPHGGSLGRSEHDRIRRQSGGRKERCHRDRLGLVLRRRPHAIHPSSGSGAPSSSSPTSSARSSSSR